MKLCALAFGWSIAVISAIGCGGRIERDVVVDDDAGATANGATASDATAGARTPPPIAAPHPIGAPPSAAPLFACASDGDGWPGPHGNLITASVTSPTTILIGERALTLTVVDKTGPESGYVDYDVHTTDGERFTLSGRIAIGPDDPAFPMEIVGPSSIWWSCADEGGPVYRDHVFDIPALDALVAATGGKTVR